MACGGNFNVIQNAEEKQVGLDFTPYEVIKFVLNNCASIELKTCGNRFTWRKGRIEGEYIFNRVG